MTIFHAFTGPLDGEKAKVPEKVLPLQSATRPNCVNPSGTPEAANFGLKLLGRAPRTSSKQSRCFHPSDPVATKKHR